MRTFITAPGQSLVTDATQPLLPPTVQANALAFVDVTGLGDEDFHVSPYTAIPVPEAWSSYPDGFRRWPGLDPAMMWNPLFWLPEEAGFIQRPDDGGGTYTESPDHRAVRVCLWLERSGLYDRANGQWVDVLDHELGLDIDDPEVLRRVSAWLRGHADEALDSIDLSAWLPEPEDPAEDSPWDRCDEDATAALDLMSPVVRYAWALDVADEMRDIASDNTLEPGPMASRIAGAIVDACRALLPGDNSDGIGDVEGMASLESNWGDRFERWVEAGGADRNPLVNLAETVASDLDTLARRLAEQAQDEADAEADAMASMSDDTWFEG